MISVNNHRFLEFIGYFYLRAELFYLIDVVLLQIKRDLRESGFDEIRDEEAIIRLQRLYFKLVYWVECHHNMAITI